MKAGNEGIVVENWDDLSGITTDKLIKLRDIATDNVRETSQAATEARTFQISVLMELSKRSN